MGADIANVKKIYTKTGDRGTTGTFLGRVAKSDALPEVLGTIDELNSAIGACRFNTAVDAELRQMQKNLLTMGSSLSGGGVKINSGETKKLEKLIDRLTKELPKLANFIYPVGSLQVARAICRRAERKVVELGTADKTILKYMNRLSDALFTVGRWVNFKSGITEEAWKI